MSKEKEVLYIPECCQKCKENCKKKSAVKEAEVFCCKRGSKIDSKKDKKKKQ